jgi:iron complex outermembrane recepter protein
VRGIRLYADGIPATGPDGQGQVSHFDIAGAQRVEVLRGPFSVLYGNSSGGVIAIFCAPPKERAVEAGIDAGSFGLVQGRAALALPLEGGFSLRVAASHLESDGFRPHSAAWKAQAHLRGAWQGPNDTVTVLLNHLDQPAQDPLGLTRAQVGLGPVQTVQVALDFDTRKTTEQNQAGLSWRHRFDEGVLRETQLAL